MSLDNSEANLINRSHDFDTVSQNDATRRNMKIQEQMGDPSMADIQGFSASPPKKEYPNTEHKKIAELSKGSNEIFQA